MTTGKWSLMAIFLVLQQMTFAQIPKNDQKQFEYAGEVTVKKAGTGELVERLAYWANQYYTKTESLEIMVDDTTKRYVEVKVTEPLVESYFGVSRQHTGRLLSYQIKFDAERKVFTYKVNNIKYKALETDPRGKEIRHDGLLSELKSPASKSLEEEVHAKLSGVIESFLLAAEVPVPVEAKPVAKEEESTPEEAAPAPDEEAPAPAE